jgi:TonB family protein
MRLTSVFLICLLLYPAVGQDSSKPSSSRGQSGFCNGDENDSPTCITPPVATYSPEPHYPVNERKAGREGAVILRLVVDTDGATHDITVARSLSPDFDSAAMDAVKTWKFTPAMRNGKPMPLRMDVQVAFHLRR